jgi:hypothetical protein
MEGLIRFMSVFSRAVLTHCEQVATVMELGFVVVPQPPATANRNFEYNGRSNTFVRTIACRCTNYRRHQDPVRLQLKRHNNDFEFKSVDLSFNRYKVTTEYTHSPVYAITVKIIIYVPS